MSTALASADLREKLETVLRPHLKFLPAGSSIDGSAKLGDLGLDSLASVNLLFDIEMELGIMIPDEDLDENTFSSLDHLERVLADLA